MTPKEGEDSHRFNSTSAILSGDTDEDGSMLD